MVASPNKQMNKTEVSRDKLEIFIKFKISERRTGHAKGAFGVVVPSGQKHVNL